MSRHHEQIKNDRRWKVARAACLDRDGYQCTWTGCIETEELQVDHRLRLSEYPELAFELDNLQTLCRPHHQEIERIRDASEETETRVTWINPDYADELASIL